MFLILRLVIAVLVLTTVQAESNENSVEVLLSHKAVGPLGPETEWVNGQVTLLRVTHLKPLRERLDALDIGADTVSKVDFETDSIIILSRYFQTYAGRSLQLDQTRESDDRITVTVSTLQQTGCMELISDLRLDLVIRVRNPLKRK